MAVNRTGMLVAGRRALRRTEALVGRPRLARTLRYLTNTVRRDYPNSIAGNGERGVQRACAVTGGGYVIDVGAHFGEWSSSLLEVAGGAVTIHAYEPSAFSADRARQRLQGRATLHQLALSDRPGRAVLHVAAQGAGTSSLVPQGGATADDRLTEEVEVSTVDEQCRRLGIEHLSLLKIDAEGHDIAVLRGAGDMLGRRAIDVVQLEYNWRWIAQRAYLRDVFDLLFPSGYLVGKVTPDGVEHYHEWHPELEKFVEGNYVGFQPEMAGVLGVYPWWGP